MRGLDLVFLFDLVQVYLFYRVSRGPWMENLCRFRSARLCVSQGLVVRRTKNDSRHTRAATYACLCCRLASVFTIQQVSSTQVDDESEHVFALLLSTEAIDIEIPG